MRKLFALFTLCVILVSGCELTDERISPSGPVSIQDREGTDFTEVEIQNGFEVEIRNGAVAAVQIETHENIHSFVEVAVFGNHLEVKLRDGFRLRNSGAVRVLITAPTLTEIEGSGGTDIRLIDLLTSNALHVDLSGGSVLFGEIEVTNLSGDLTGGSEIDVVGMATNYQLAASGGSEAEDFGLIVERLTVDLSGGSTLDVTVNGELSVDATGGSVVNFRGEGTIITQRLSGGSEVNRR